MSSQEMKKKLEDWQDSKVIIKRRAEEGKDTVEGVVDGFGKQSGTGFHTVILKSGGKSITIPIMKIEDVDGVGEIVGTEEEEKAVCDIGEEGYKDYVCNEFLEEKEEILEEIVQKSEEMNKEMGFMLCSDEDKIHIRGQCEGESDCISWEPDICGEKELVGSFHTHPDSLATPSLGDVVSNIVRGETISCISGGGSIMCYESLENSSKTAELVEKKKKESTLVDKQNQIIRERNKLSRKHNNQFAGRGLTKSEYRKAERLRGKINNLDNEIGSLDRKTHRLEAEINNKPLHTPSPDEDWTAVCEKEI